MLHTSCGCNPHKSACERIAGCSSTAPRSRGASGKSVLDCVVNAGVNQARDALHTIYPMLYLFDNTIHVSASRCRALLVIGEAAAPVLGCM